MYEIHAFRGEATVPEGNAMGYEPGSRHAVIVFSGQAPGSDHDFALAKERAEVNGLLEVNLDEAGKLRAEAVPSMQPEMASAYQSAVEQGYGVVVYSEAIT
jgi:hypothetical protein